MTKEEARRLAMELIEKLKKEKNICNREKGSKISNQESHFIFSRTIGKMLISD